jgi:hypothetical protein
VPLVFVLLLPGPGAAVLGRSDWRPGERATAAVALSFLLVGLASFLIFALRLHPLTRTFLLCGCAGLGLAVLPRARRMFAEPGARRALAWCALLALWVVALQAVVRCYSGGDAYADWEGHYQRARFLIAGGRRLDVLFAGTLLPARPPLVNAFAAQVMAFAGRGFPSFELTAGLLAILAFVPALQVARLFSRSPEVPRILALILMFSPMFVQNATYAWTKQQAALFSLAALAFYVAGWREHDPRRTRFAFVCAAGGILTHYTAVPYALFLGLHYVLFILPRRERRVRDFVMTILPATLVLAPWFAWAAAVYGADAVVTTALATTGEPPATVAGRLGTAALNLRDTLVPHLLRDVAWDPRSTGLTWGHLRDATFLVYQGNLVFAPGACGALLLALEALSRRRRRAVVAPSSDPRRPDTPWFWAAFVIFAVVVGIGVHSRHEPFGLAYCAQQPVIYLAIAFLAARFGEWPRSWRALAVLGLAVDALVGVLLHFWLQSYPLDLPDTFVGPLGLRRADLLVGTADWNWSLKQSAGLAFIGDTVAFRTTAIAAIAAIFVFGLTTLVRAAAKAGRAGPASQSSPRTSASSVATST